MNLRGILLCVLCVGAGFLVGKCAYKPVSIRETAAPEIQLPSGGIIAERSPEAAPPPIVAEASKAVGGKPVRAGTLVVKPTPKEAPKAVSHEISSETPSSTPCECPEVKIDWGLVRTPEGNRMAFSVDGGTILSATDIPLEPVEVRRKLKWGAGVSYSTEREYGAWVRRDLGRLTVGLHVENRHREGLTASVLVGVRW